MYDTQTGAQNWRVALSASIQEPDNLLFVGADQPFSIMTVDPSTGDIVRTYNGSGDSTAVMEYSQLSLSGKIIVAAGQRGGTTGGQLQFINLLTGTTIFQMTTQGSVLAISYDDAQYVSRAYTQGAATLLADLNTHQILRVLPLTASSSEYWSTFGFSRDSRKLLGVSSAGANNPGGGRNARPRVFTVK